MKVIQPKLKAASIAIKKELYDLLKVDANFVSQIPDRYKSVQLNPHPYFIFEDEPLKRIVYELREKERSKLNDRNGNRIAECDKILSLLNKEHPVLIYVSLTA